MKQSINHVINENANDLIMQTDMTLGVNYGSLDIKMNHYKH